MTEITGFIILFAIASYLFGDFVEYAPLLSILLTIAVIGIPDFIVYSTYEWFQTRKGK